MRSRARRERELEPAKSAMLEEVLSGLSQRPKSLPCKLFYDAVGSRLFEQICELPEYYPTRTELAILRDHLPEMARRIGPDRVLVEFGSGASVKTRLLLDALERPRAYVPIDISRSALLSSAAALGRDYPALEIRPLCADYTAPLDLPLRPGERRIAVFFPGSTIGNFDPPEAVEFLRRARKSFGEEQVFLIGVDLRKDPRVLEAAYDDRQGVTAEFNRNILRVINRECGARFAIETFRHHAVWNDGAGRIEMHLVSELAQRVELGGVTIRFEAGEPIVTEHCYKYEVEGFAELARRSGYRVSCKWTDADSLFGVLLLEPDRAQRAAT